MGSLRQWAITKHNDCVLVCDLCLFGVGICFDFFEKTRLFGRPPLGVENMKRPKRGCLGDHPWELKTGNVQINTITNAMKRCIFKVRRTREK